MSGEILFGGGGDWKREILILTIKDECRKKIIVNVF